MAYFLPPEEAAEGEFNEDEFWLDNFHGFGGMDFLHDVDMAELYNVDDDDFFDPDDFDELWTDEDDDSFLDAEDHNKIFISLQDSHVLKRLNFHRAASKFRLPRLRRSAAETYESVHKALEELEILLKVWKKRTEHAYTAHIQRSGDKKSNGGGEGEDGGGGSGDDVGSGEDMLLGVDYNDSDIAHESDDDEAEDYSRATANGIKGAGAANGSGEGIDLIPDCNEALTKKKYCHSTRVFYSIFDGPGGDKQFDSFCASVRLIRKQIHAIVYSLFHGSLPTEISRLLPRELWEKIWKHTQSPYDEGEIFNCGCRFAKSRLAANNRTPSEQRKLLLLERAKLSDLFGAVGNFHMLVFEILYKNAYISRTPDLMEVESMDTTGTSKSNKPNSYVKTRFLRFKRLLEMAFSRLISLHQQVDEEESLANNNEEANDAASSAASTASGSTTTKNNANLSLIQKINRGYFTSRKVVLPGEFNTALKTFSADYGHHHHPFLLAKGLLIPPSIACDVVAKIESETREDEQSYLKLAVWNVRRRAQVAQIETGLTMLKAVYGRGGSSINRLFDLGPSRLTFLLRSEDKLGQLYNAIYTWSFDPEAEETAVMGAEDAVIDSKVWTPPVKISYSSSRYYDSSEMVIKSAELSSGPVIVLSHADAPFESDNSVVRLYDVETRRELEEKRIELGAKDGVYLECAKGNRAILRHERGRRVLFVDLENACVVAEYPYAELCKNAGHVHTHEYMPECRYEVRMDQDPESRQFILFSQNVMNFELFEYSTESPASQPEVINSNASSLVYELPFRSLDKISLYRGSLYACPRADVAVRHHCGDYFEDQAHVSAVDFFAFDLSDCTLHPIINMIEKEDDGNRSHHHHHKGSGGVFPTHYVNDKVLLNEHSRLIYPTVGSFYSSPFFAGPNAAVLAMDDAFIEVNFHPDPKSVNGVEGIILAEEERRREESERRRRAKGANRKKRRRTPKEPTPAMKEEIAEARTAVADQDVELKGRVKKWEYSHGFLSVAEPAEYKKIGGVFVHISDIENRRKRKIRSGQKVSFKVVTQPGNRYKAAGVRLL